MLLDAATVEDNFQRFISRVIENEIVFCLKNDAGIANSVSNDDDETVILMFWSDAAYARRSENILPEHFDVDEIALFDFLYRWLPGMSGDGVLAGPNWTGDLVGREIDPYELRMLIENRLPHEVSKKYVDMYEGAVENDES